MSDIADEGAGQPRVLPGYLPAGIPDPRTAQRVAGAWVAGALVGLPTETVYGLSADADNASAVTRIYQVKGRPSGHPLIVHVAGPAAVPSWSRDCDPRVAALLDRFWPGPLTVVVPRSQRAGDYITGGQETVALRCPGHPVALAALRAFADLTCDPAAGVAAPSANRFGRVSPTTAADVLAELALSLRSGDLVVDGGPSRVGVESTIVDCTGASPRVLRPGAIGAAQLCAVWDAQPNPSSALSPDRGQASQRGGLEQVPHTRTAPSQPRVPGTLSAHYAPRVRLRCVEVSALPALIDELASGGATRVGLLAEEVVPDVPGWVRLARPADAAEYAAGLYGALRQADTFELDLLIAVLPSPAEPLGRAVRDRLMRAGAGSGR